MNSFLPALARCETLLQDLGEVDCAQQFASIRRALQSTELNVVVFGEFSRGKSTLINAMLGRVVLPAKLVPTTGQVTRVVFGRQERVEIELSSGETGHVPLDQLGSITNLDFDRFARDDVATVKVFVNSPLLQPGVALIDTPGVNDQECQTQRALAALSEADLVILVLDARQLLSSHESDLGLDWLGKELGKPLVPVVNFLGLVEPGQRPEIMLRMDRWCRRNLSPVLGQHHFVVDALPALKNALAGKPVDSPDLRALLLALTNCQGQRRSRLQNQSRLGQLRYALRLSSDRNDAVLTRFRVSSAELEQTRACERQELKDIARRFEGNSKAFRDAAVVTARVHLGSQLDSLTRSFVGVSKAQLDLMAGSAYQEKLLEGARQAEKAALQQLLRLSSEKLGRPAPFTVSEKLALRQRIEVADQPAEVTSTGVAAGVVGALIGTFLIPVPGVGTGIGWMVGWVAGHLASQQTPDYAALFAKAARDAWTQDAENVVNMIAAEFDQRLAEFRERGLRRFEQLRPQAASREESQRQALSGALAACEMESKTESNFA